MKRTVFAVCGITLAAVLCGCASQQIVQREFYEPNEATMREREENAPAPQASGCLSARCTCGEAVRFPDERSEEPCEARLQEGAREPRRGCKGPRLKVGTLKSETVKTGSIRPLRVARPVDEPRLAYGEAEPDWSTKSISIISVGK